MGIEDTLQGKMEGWKQGLGLSLCLISKGQLVKGKVKGKVNDKKSLDL
jgi:hypothetical protein